MAKKKERPVEDGSIEVALEWDDDSSLTTVYANQLFVRHTDNEFYLVFGEVNVPPRSGSGVVEQPSSLVVQPVARIAISPIAMLSFVDVINRNIEKFKDKFEDQSNSDEKD